MMPYLAGWKTTEKLGVNFEEQIISKKKYPSIFSPQMEAIVFIILQIFFATRAIFKIGKYFRLLKTGPLYNAIQGI